MMIYRFKQISCKIIAQSLPLEGKKRNLILELRELQYKKIFIYNDR